MKNNTKVEKGKLVKKKTILIPEIEKDEKAYKEMVL